MSNTNSVTNNFEIKSYWLYNGLREIVVLESSLDKIITNLFNLDNIDNEKSIIDAISVIRDICNSIPILQRKKLIELSVFENRRKFKLLKKFELFKESIGFPLRFISLRIS